MKRKSFILLAVAIATLSCVKERTERAGDRAKQKISFSTRFDVTRGSIIGTEGDMADKGGFNVWAVGHTAAWASATDKTALVGLDGATVTSPDGGTTWDYGTPVRWPSDRYVSFFACGPAAAATVTMTGSEPTIDFTVAPQVANQKDLMVAIPRTDQRGSAYSYGASVALFFEHALSRVLFSTLLVNEPGGSGRTVKVKEIVLGGIYGSGTTAFNPIDWTPDTGGGMTSYTLSIANGALKDGIIGDDAALGEDGIITKDNGYMFLIPQRLARATDAPTMDVVLEITKNGKPAETRHESLIVAPIAWEPGKSYNYRIAIDGDDVKLILIDSGLDLKDWNVNIMVQPISLNKLSMAHLQDEQVTEAEIEEYLPDDYENLTDKEKDEARAAAITAAQTAQRIRRTKTASEARLHSALNAFATLSGMTSDDIPEMPDNNAKYYAVYVSGEVEYDIDIDMTNTDYDKFPAGKQVIFDIEKLITKWDGVKTTVVDDSGGTSVVSISNYTFSIAFDPQKWELQPARQPYPELDATTSATTLAIDNSSGGKLGPNYDNMNTPSNFIQNKGSIILERK